MVVVVVVVVAVVVVVVVAVVVVAVAVMAHVKREHVVERDQTCELFGPALLDPTDPTPHQGRQECCK